MAVVTITPANIEKVDDATLSSGTLEASTTTAGGELIRSTSTGYVKADASSLTSATIAGIAWSKGSVGKQIDFFNSVGKEVDIGATLTEGIIYVVSGTAGAIEPYADLSTGERAYMVGIGMPSTNLKYLPYDLGVAT